MTLEHHTCVSGSCDTCGDGWDEDGAWHFATVEETLDHLRTSEWIVTDGRLVCPVCALRADCEATGHQYGPWETHSANGVNYQERYCDHCGSYEFNPPREQLETMLRQAVQARLADNSERRGELN